MYDRLFDYIRKHALMRPGDRVGVAVSGGADSVALLRLLLELRDELGTVLSVVHFNHKLRGKESDDDEEFVRALAAEHGLEFVGDAADTRGYASEHKCGIEAAARELRYEFFRQLLAPQGDAEENHPLQTTRRDTKVKLDRIATAHTMDDQAETVLLRFLRGAGTRGLAGIHPVLRKEPERLKAAGRTSESVIVRPLLEFRRAQLRHYLKRNSQPWREDSSNRDVTYSRNKLRHELMPKVREFNRAIEQVLSETAEIARAEEDYWREIVGRELPALGTQSIDIGKLLLHPLALQRHLLRAVAESHGLRLEFHHVQQVLDLATEPSTRAEKKIELADEWDACIVERELRFVKRCPTGKQQNYEFAFPVPGEVVVPAAGLVLRATCSKPRGAALLDADIVGKLTVRNWRAGDRYWPAHTRESKKIKELLQARQVPAQARAHWPVVVAQVEESEQIVWVPGFAFPERFLLTKGSGPGLMLKHRARA